MTVENERSPGIVVLTFSGEIYNFVELKLELRSLGHNLITRSDTEVLLHAYLEWGEDCPTHFTGIFAFAIWDAQRGILFLARDRLGVKPLYYTVFAHGLAFASEPKGILHNPRFTPRVMQTDIPIILNPRLGLPHEVPVAGIVQVEPGFCLSFGREGILRKVQYWRLTAAEHLESGEETAMNVRSLLKNAVEEQLCADVPVSCLLSGGLDSSAVSALAQVELSPERLRTYCVAFGADSKHFKETSLRPELDSPYARQVAQALDTSHATVSLTTEAVLNALPRARRARDLPSMGQFDSSMLLLFENISQVNKVCLSAEGADEIFGGYPWYHDETRISSSTFPWLGNAPLLTNCLRPEIQREVGAVEAVGDRLQTLLGRVSRLDGEGKRGVRMREALFLGLQGPLLYLLDRKDRMSMDVGLEVRVPFCDHRLVEYAWNIPWVLQAADGREKSVLRAAVSDLLPNNILTRRKSAYPGLQAPESDRYVLDYVRRMPADLDSPFYELLDGSSISRLVEDTARTTTWVNSAHFLTPLMEADLWMKELGLRFS